MFYIILTFPHTDPHVYHNSHTCNTINLPLSSFILTIPLILAHFAQRCYPMHLCCRTACAVILLTTMKSNGTAGQAAPQATWLHLRENGYYYLNLPRDNWSEYYPLRVVWSKLRLSSREFKEGALIPHI